MLNTIPTEGIGRRPRGAVLLNGQRIEGWISLEVDNNAFAEADTFRVLFVISNLPKERGADWFASQVQIDVELLAGFPADPDDFNPAELKSLILGRVDDLVFDPVAGVVELCGRDYTAVLIDSQTTEKWVNQTASQIATAIAKRHGLTPVVTATKGKAGKYYKIDQVRQHDRKSEWELLSTLARHEFFDVYVAGKELHFEPEPPESTEPYVLEWEAPTDSRASPTLNAIDMRFSRNLTLAKGVQVTLHSHNLATGKPITVSWPKPGDTSARPGKSAPSAQQYVRSVPNKTPEQLLQLAQKMHRDITQHEVKLTASLPGDDLLTPRQVIKVTGTGSQFDQVYFPESVTRRLSLDEGYRMEVRAKNHNPANEAT
ncbi:phage late control D family protein [Chitinimonas naiadis]